MRFHKLSATFGKLQKQTLELGDGLNIIESANEGGKSTWAAFLRAMLYGIDTKERDKKGSIAEKNRYQPWAGGAMEGSAEISWQGKEITLRRTTPRPNAPMGKFEAVYTGTEEPVPELTGDMAGERLTGVGREVFERSAFVGQSSLSVDSAPELERRVAAIVTSGQEDVSYSQAEKRLREWRNRRQSNLKNGLIPKLEEERTQVREKLERLEGAARQAAGTRAELTVLEGERAALEGELQAHRQAGNAARRAQYEAAQAELTEARAALEAAQAERTRHGVPPGEEALRAAQGDLSYLNTLEANIKQAKREAEEAGAPAEVIEHPVFQGMDPAAVKVRAEADAKAAQSHRMDAESGGMTPEVRMLFICILLAAGLGLALAGLVFHSNPILMAVIGGAALIALVAVGVYHIVTGWQRSMRIFKMLDSYGAREGKEIIAQAKDYIARWEEAEAARTECAVRAVSQERLEAEREELAEQLLTFAREFAPEVTDLFGVSAAISRALKLQEQEKSAQLRLDSAQRVFDALSAQGEPPAEEEEAGSAVSPDRPPQETAARLSAVQGEIARLNSEAAMAQGEMNTLGDPAALQARLGELEGELERRRAEYEALDLALDALGEANAQLQARFSPALNEAAGELLHRLTGGKYDRVSLTRQFEALAAGPGDPAPHKALTLSQGTADQLYLAVRLAVCKLALPPHTPLVLDDALVNFDDERMKLALALLRELAKDTQILLFTCHSREAASLANAKGVRVIRL